MKWYTHILANIAVTLACVVLAVILAYGVWTIFQIVRLALLGVF